MSLGKIFQFGENSKGLTIPLEAALISHAVIEGHLSTMSKRRMAEVVAEACRLNQAKIGKEFDCRMLGILRSNLSRNASSDLSYFKGMSKTRPIKIAIAKVQNLGLTLKSSE
jgi:hypothetical protein